MLSEVTAVLLRDLDGFKSQVELYPDDAALWQVVEGCPNAGGTLALHAAGNLRHYIGARLGNTGYVRDREEEFSARDLPRNEILARLLAAQEEVGETLRKLNTSLLDSAYPEKIGGRRFTTGLYLLHLATHLAYHLGQTDYHRRAITGDATSAGTLSFRQLPELP
ncbi:MAG: DinB family protein [Rhodothermia bacterium]|nr:DinB family protein [Rhodothermia bacterium]